MVRADVAEPARPLHPVLSQRGLEAGPQVQLGQGLTLGEPGLALSYAATSPCGGKGSARPQGPPVLPSGWRGAPCCCFGDPFHGGGVRCGLPLHEAAPAPSAGTGGRTSTGFGCWRPADTQVRRGAPCGSVLSAGWLEGPCAFIPERVFAGEGQWDRGTHEACPMGVHPTPRPRNTEARGPTARSFPRGRGVSTTGQPYRLTHAACGLDPRM